jgi:hypothetical protein
MPKDRPIHSKRGDLSNATKGRMVEQVVAALHQGPGVTVERNVRMRPAGGQGAKREIDVLLTSQVAGYPVRFAIECKNERKPIGVERIDAFAGKLTDVGIPVAYGIFVSASGYTRDAVGAARRYGLRALTLDDLTKKLPESVMQALQTVLYMFLSVESFNFQNFIARETEPGELWWFKNKDGEDCGTWIDLIWRDWLAGKIPDTIGTHQIPLEIPSGWHLQVDGKPIVTSSASATVNVQGLLVSLQGTVTAHQLVSALDGAVDRAQLSASFEPGSTTATIEPIETEEELRNRPKQIGGLHVATGRIRLPRIDWQGMLLPPSERVHEIAQRRMQAFLDGKAPDPRPFGSFDLEGGDLSVFFEPLVLFSPDIKSLWDSRTEPQRSNDEPREQQ